MFMRTNSSKGSLPVVVLGSAAIGVLLVGLFRNLGIGGRGADDFPSAPVFTQNRVKVEDYGSLSRNDSRLAEVPGINSRTIVVHREMADRLNALIRDADSDGFTDIRIASGHRPHRWESWDQYAEAMRMEYGSVDEGRRWKAYKSPHETGLAVDFGSHGLYPSRSGQGPFGLSNEQQKQTPFYKWLKANAHKYGITPYKLEAWHWEARIPYKDWV